MSILLPSAAVGSKTRANDATNLRSWGRFCQKRALRALPTTAAALRAYISDMPPHVTAATLRHVVASVRRWHIDAGLADPADENFAQDLYHAQKRCRVPELRPCRSHDLAKLVDSISETPGGLRDIVFILLTYTGRMSSSAFTLLSRSDVHIGPWGMRLTVFQRRRSTVLTFRRYQDARYCVVAAMERYVRIINDDHPALFRVCSPGHISRRRLSLRRAMNAIRYRVAQSGLPIKATTALRAGMIVTSTNRGADDYAIMRQHGYANTRTVRKLQARLGLNQIDVVDRLGM